MGNFWEGCPPQFTEDGTLAEFQQDLRNIGLAEGEFYNDALQLLRDVLRLAQMHRCLSLGNLAHVLGTGTHPGTFWTYLSWLLEHGILMRGDMPHTEGLLVLGPYGTALWEGFRIYGVDADRWRAIPADTP